MSDPALLAPALPAGFAAWPPLWQGVTLAVSTFVQEDLPTVGAALLSAAGTLPWLPAFLGCFLGIWVGDALLYALARTMGRPLLDRPWFRRWVQAEAVKRSEQWFARRGVWLLLGSRFVPGTRLPTYLAAGFLRVPFGRFLAVTGVAVAVWTAGIFAVARWGGREWLAALPAGLADGWGWLLGALAGVALLRGLVQVGRRSLSREGRAWWGRWTRWEFWPAWMFYLPVVCHCVRLAVRHRGLTVPTAANPGIFSGGLVGESKLATLQDLHRTCPEFTAEACLVAGATAEARLASWAELTQRAGFGFPCILKPDYGQRGAGVKLIRNHEQGADYLRVTRAPLILQRYAPGPCEAGLFYYRHPDERHGRLFAITEKLFPVVIGDGTRPLEELIWADERARFAAGTYLRRLGAGRTRVPAPGEVVRLVEAGNHAQGCIFRDGGHLWSEALEQRVDEISRRIDGFFIGRYDVRYATDDDLRAGRAFQIVELNGAAAEATSIYDARNSLRSAYRTLFRQWELVFAIGAANRSRGVVPTAPGLLWRRWRETAGQIAGYPVAD